MAAQTNLLFPELPPELRHTIYANLSSPFDPALTTSLPIKLKTFSCRHTTIQVTPVHHGSASLLALQAQNCLEASEYAAWLVKNDITLQIGVVFKGRINTFVHADWAKKTEAHLRKLFRSHPWLSKVGRYEVRIWWEPVDGVLRSSLRGGKKRRTAGMVVKDMVRTLLSCMDGDVARRKGDVKLVLGIDHACVVEGILKGVHFGVGDLVEEKWRGMKRVGVKVMKGEGKKKEDGDGVEKKRFMSVEKDTDKVMMEAKAEQVVWVDMGATKVNLA